MTTKVEKVIYQAHATSTGGRDGTTRTSDGLLDLKLAVPKEMGGAGGAEALVAKAHAVCPYSNATRGNIEVTITVV